MCKKLFPDNTYTVSAREKNLLDSPLQNMANISRTCKNQVACLENSPNIHEQIKKAGTYTSDLALHTTNYLKWEQNLECDINDNGMSSEEVLDEQVIELI